MHSFDSFASLATASAASITLKAVPCFLAILLANEEDLTASPLDQFVDVASPCPMFFAASEKAPLFPTRRFLRGVEKFEAPNKQV